MKNFNKVFTVIVLLFLYIPMIVLAVGSFNSGMDIAVFKSFTFDNYKELFRDSVLLPLLLNSVIVALLSRYSQPSSAPAQPSAFTRWGRVFAASRWALRIFR